MGDRRQRRRRRLIRSVRRDSPRDRSTEMCERDLVHHTPECIGLYFFVLFATRSKLPAPSATASATLRRTGTTYKIRLDLCNSDTQNDN